MSGPAALLRISRCLAVLTVLFSVTTAHPADAQSSAADLRTRQAELFRALSDDPANLELMFAYAVASMQIEDYEAAISTLERMLFFNPDLSRVKLELAVAYYRLGVYDVARLHFERVLADDPPQEVQDRIAPFLAAIDQRTARHSFSGFASIGGIYSSNATLGPPDREVRAEFFPGGAALIPADADQEPDFGIRAVGSVVHSYDMQRPNDDAWITTGDYSGIRYSEVKAGELDAFFVTTGPRLALDDEAYGLKGRPYGGAGFVRSAGDALYAQYGGGFELTDSLSPEVAAFGLGTAEWRDFFGDQQAFDGLYAAAIGGMAYAPDRTGSYRAAAIFETDRTSEKAQSNNEFGVRLAATRVVDFSNATDIASLERPWRFTAYAYTAYRLFDEPDPTVDRDTTRQDIDVRGGLRAMAPVTDSLAVAADLSYYHRFSNIENFELRNLEVGLSLIKFF